MANDYEVGRGKPPKHTQFKKGQSGNPKGRPRKGVKLATSMDVVRYQLIDAMEQAVPVTINGKTRKLPAIVAMYHQLWLKAMKGDFRSAKLVIDLYQGCVQDDEDQRMRLLETVLEYEKAWDAYYKDCAARKNRT